MIKYWALDYVNSLDNECELVFNDQLYHTEDAAQEAAKATGRPDLFDVTWYGIKDLEELYDGKIIITADLHIFPLPSSGQL